jgi:2-keto-4-pentenoate hydratase
MNKKNETTFSYLRDLWRRGEVCGKLPVDLLPQSKPEAYAVQALVERESRTSLVAWKIAATSVAGQKHIGVNGPLVGRYIEEQIVPSGGVILFGRNRMRVAEIEFAFLLSEDIAPRSAAFSEGEVLERIGAIHPSIEIPDSRFAAFETVGELQLIADNACAHWLCIGEAMDPVWRMTDLAALQPVGTIRGRTPVTGLGANVLGGPVMAMTWFVNEMSGLGVMLCKGQFVTTGTCLVPMAVSAGDHVTGDFGRLGRVTVELL